MSLMLAPYNDSMRLGMGFNSYSQTMCIDKAVEFSAKQVVRSENPSQVVTYSSKCVNRLSDIVKSMNVSYSTSIKKGTVEVAGSSNTINEDKIKESDINAVVSVKVVNQTTIVDETATFKPVDGISPGSPDFNDRFGDCFISGFIEGGDFNGIVSIRVLDRSKTEEVVAKVKKGLGSGGGASDFTLDIDNFSHATKNSDISNETEATISVAWMGGGQIKDPNTPWNMDSVYEAAAAFPSRVAQTPQKTWAILTKYKANRSFVEWSAKERFSPLEYDSIASYTAELFDSYMEYKQLLKLVENIIANPTQYKEKDWRSPYIPIVTSTLVAVKAAFRIEMSKIVQAVDILSRDPHVLKRDTGMEAEPNNELVRDIVRLALTGGFDNQFGSNLSRSKAVLSADPRAATDLSDTEPANAPLDPPQTAPSPTSIETPAGTFNPKAMIAPEIWSDLLPTPSTVPTTTNDGDIASTMPTSLAKMFPPAPDSDLPSPAGGATASNKLEIVFAVVAFEDVTDTLQSMVKDDNTLAFRASAIKSLFGISTAKSSSFDLWTYLTFLYRYSSDGPLRLCIVREEDSTSGVSDTTTLFEVNKESKFPIVLPSPWNEATWSLTALVYGGTHYADRGLTTRLLSDIKVNLDKTGIRWLPSIDNGYVGEDPWPRKAKTAVVFYQAKSNGRIRAAVGIEVKGVPNSQAKMTSSLETNGTMTRAGSAQMSAATSLQVAATSVRTKKFIVKEQSDSVPFLAFENGVAFFLTATGHLKIVDNGEVFTRVDEDPPHIRSGCAMLFPGKDDGKIVFTADPSENRADAVYQTLGDAEGISKGESNELMFRDSLPYVEIGARRMGMWRTKWQMIVLDR